MQSNSAVGMFLTFPTSRISYQVVSKIGSRTVLDTQGSEKLLGNGDMLFLPPWTARIRRIHGAYVSEREINAIVEFVKKNQGEPKFLEGVTKVVEEKSGVDGIEYLDDIKYDDAVRVVLSTGQASASYLQRRLKLGYSRAARLIEIMEANGVVGPSQVEAARGTAPRRRLSFCQWADLNIPSKSCARGRTSCWRRSVTKT